jgi:transposase
MPIVAEQYTFVIGVDTHAATHSLALVTAATGAVVDEAVFPNAPPGLDRARGWIARRIAEQAALVVIEGVGSYGAGLAQRVTDAGMLVAEPSEMPASARRGVGKTDSLEHAEEPRADRDPTRLAGRKVDIDLPDGADLVAAGGADVASRFRDGV